MQLQDVWTLQTRGFAEGQKNWRHADSKQWINGFFKHFMQKLHGFYASDEHLVGLCFASELPQTGL